MFPSSFPIGRFMGVELRVHASLLLLLSLAIFYSSIVERSAARGMGLCFALLFAIAVREVARAFAAAWQGLHLRALLIFPIGGIMAFGSVDSDMEAATRFVTLVTPVANLLAGGLLLGFCYGIDPRVDLLSQPLISAHHVLRSVVWVEFLLGAVSLVPVAMLTSRRLATPQAPKDANATARTLPAFDLGAALGISLFVLGLARSSIWLATCGAFILLSSLLRSGSSQDVATATQSLRVRDAMQTDYTLLSSSDTLLSALERVLGSAQEIFPIVRGDRLVGSIARDTLSAQLRAEGDGYLQGVMTRTLPVAGPEETLSAALRRSAAMGTGELIAVAEGGSLIGILTQAGVVRAMQRSAAIRTVRDAETGE
ncbi:MAG TPA: CBS domain-containing protein [Acidobacteriaceae bacterium]|jgi:predicted transcriptional regulator